MLWPTVNENGTRLRTGSAMGTGTDLFLVNPDFTPRVVMVLNLANGSWLFWTLQMGSGAATVRGGGGVEHFITTGGITPVEDLDLETGGRGFIIGPADGANTAGSPIYWAAWE